MTEILEVLWTLLLVVAIDGDGAGRVVTERFGPYESQAACEDAAQSFASPVVNAGRFNAGLHAYCVPAS